MNETIIEVEILQKIELLNNNTYAMCCRLTRYKDKLTEPLYKYMADRLYTVYREEFRRIYDEYEITYEQEKYTHKKRRGKFIPREGWLFHRKNKAAKHFTNIVKAASDTFFAEQESATAQTCPTSGVNLPGEKSKSTNVVNVQSETSEPTCSANKRGKNELPTPQSKEAKK